MYSKSIHYDNYNYEYNMLKSIINPSIVKCYGCTEDSQNFYLELEFCMTGDLSKCFWQNKNSHVIIEFNLLVQRKSGQTCGHSVTARSTSASQSRNTSLQFKAQ